ncbi:MAG: polymer-forming cytoskeletal protein [Thermomicrobiales bacterium]
MSYTSEADPAARPTSIDNLTGTAATTTVIDANTVVDGTLSTSHDLRVDGQVTGTLTCRGVLLVTEGAEVDATVEASSIVVAGTLSGSITCHGRLDIRSTGIVRGRVDTGRLIVVEGAVYEGQLRMDPTAEAAELEVAGSEPLESEGAPATESTGSYSFLRSFAPGTSPSTPVDDALPASRDDEEPR